MIEGELLRSFKCRSRTVPPDKSGGYSQDTPNGVRKKDLNIQCVLPLKVPKFSRKGNEIGIIKTDKSL